LLLLGACPAVAEEVEIPREHHPWSRFEPGSWTRFRQLSETTQDGQTTARIDETTTTLVGVHKDGFELIRDVKSGDTTLKGKPVRYLWDGTIALDDATREKLQQLGQPIRETVKFSLGEVDVDGKTYACQTHERVAGDGVVSRTIKSWYSPDQSPYFLKRIDRVTAGRPRLTVMRVTKTSGTRNVLGKEVVGWQSETLHSAPQVKSETTAFHSMEIPGGVVSSEMVRLDAGQGIKKTIKREVVAFEAKLP
jgi:hypothetical protein